MSAAHCGYAAMPAAQTEADDGRPRQASKRLHFLDWLRALMVVFVVYAHSTRMGLSGGVSGEVDVDDRTYTLVDPSPLGVRWVSVVRPWALPLLFWVSGAACACSFRGALRGLDKLFLFTLVGMASNAALWYLGPQDKMCSPDNQCPGQGVLFDFTVCPWAGKEFAILFQMWYTIVLMLLMVLNWPLFAVIHGSRSARWLALQWLGSCAFYGLLVWAAGASCPRPAAVLLALAAGEAAFLGLSAVAAGRTSGDELAAAGTVHGFPLRAVHYALAAVVLLQFGATPFASGVDSISAAFVLFIFVGFNRFFALGFVMTRGKAEPLCFRVWPLGLLALVFCSPSTNWKMAGNLTYPYFQRVWDRCLYVAFGILVIFVLDRIGRDMDCLPLPSLLNWTSLVLYLFHPVWITVLVSLGVFDIEVIWLASVAITACLVAVAMLVGRSFAGKGEEDEERDEEDTGSSEG